MGMYLIVVLLVLPGQAAPTYPLQTSWITASSKTVCETEAAKLAAIHRQIQADVIRTSNAKVQATCEFKGDLS